MGKIDSKYAQDNGRREREILIKRLLKINLIII